MSKGNFLMGTASGKLGDVVFYRSRGSQRARTYIKNPKNPKSNAQMQRRAIWAISATAFKNSKFAFFPMKNKHSNYAEWQRINAKKCNVQLYASIEEVRLSQQYGVFPFDFYQLAKGNLTAPAEEWLISFDQQEGTMTVRRELPQTWLNRYLPLFGDSATEVTISASDVINDFIFQVQGNTELHPTIVVGQIMKCNAIGVEGQSDFYHFNTLKAIEIFAEKFTNDLTLTINEERTQVILADTSFDDGRDLSCMITNDAPNGLVEFSFIGGAFDTEKITGATPAGFFRDLIYLRRVGGYDCSNCVVSESKLTQVLPYSYMYPRLVGDSETPVDLLYEENWRNTNISADAEVL